MFVEPVAKIIAIIPSDNFILHIIHSIVFQNGICVHGRPELYLAMLPHIYEVSSAFITFILFLFSLSGQSKLLIFNMTTLLQAGAGCGGRKGMAIHQVNSLQLQGGWIES